MYSPDARANHSLKLACILSLIAGLGMAGASLAGLLLQNSLYPTDELRHSFLANEVVNLIIGLPALLASLWLWRRGQLAGLLLWPGALLYILYNYLAYLIGIPFGWLFPIYLILVGLSAYLFFFLLSVINQASIPEQLAGVAPVKTAGSVLVGLGALFLLRALGMIVTASLDQMALPRSDIGVLAADMLLSLIWIAGGVSLLRRRPLGVALGLGLLYSGSMLFIALIVFILLGPALTGTPLAWMDVIVVLLMGMVCFIPFYVYLKRVLSKGKLHHENYTL